MWFEAWNATVQPKLDRLLATSRDQEEGWSKDNGEQFPRKKLLLRKREHRLVGRGELSHPRDAAQKLVGYQHTLFWSPSAKEGPWI